jgi:hypothetical protein
VIAKALAESAYAVPGDAGATFDDL